MNSISKLMALVVAAALVLVALGTGAYLAMRQNGSTTPQAASIDTLSLPDAPGHSSGAVTETEAEIGEPAAEAAPSAPVVVDPPAVVPAPRAAAPARPRAVPARPAPARPAPEPARQAEAQPEVDRSWPESRPSMSERIETRPGEAGSIGLPTETPSAVEPVVQFEEVVVPAEAVIGLQIEQTITTEQARIEDRVDARVTRDVRAGGLVAIPAGARVIGSVTFVEPGGKVKERARLGVRFHTLVLADGTRLPIETESIFREGESPAGESAAKIGGAAVGGAILGAILGGGRGAAIGGSVGAAGGTAAVMAGGRNPATLPAGTQVTARLTSPVTVTIEK